MLIKTRRDLPATSWLQTRSSFWLAIAQHPLQTGIHSLSWMNRNDLQQLRKPLRTKALGSVLLGCVALVGITFATQASMAVYQKSSHPYNGVSQPSPSVTGDHRLQWKALTQEQTQWMQMWQSKVRLWNNAQEQYQTLQVQEDKEKGLKRILATTISNKYRIAPSAAARVVDKAYEAAHSHGVNPVLLLAVVGVESRFNPLAGSTAGAVGLVQAMAKAHPDKVKPVLEQGGSLTDVETNLDIGAQILREYLTSQHGNISMALQQYNGSLKDPRQSYSKQVLAVKAKFEDAISTHSTNT